MPFAKRGGTDAAATRNYAKRNGGADSRKVVAKKGRRLGGLAPSDACCTTDIVIICPPEACNIEMRLRWISCHINMEIWRNFRFAMFCGGPGGLEAPPQGFSNMASAATMSSSSHPAP